MLTDTTLAQRFQANVDTSGDCWLWTGPLRYYGAGEFTYMLDGKQRKVVAHKASWELHHGPIPDGLRVVQTCGNTLCVNPAHLHLSASRLTVIQRRFACVELPDAVPWCSRRDWQMFTSHVRDHTSYEELSVAYHVHVKTARRIVANVAALFVNPPAKHRRFHPPPHHERPAGVRDRDWSIYCRYIHGKETMRAIALDHGMSGERVWQIVISVGEKRA